MSPQLPMVQEAPTPVSTITAALMRASALSLRTSSLQRALTSKIVVPDPVTGAGVATGASVSTGASVGASVKMLQVEVLMSPLQVCPAVHSAEDDPPVQFSSRVKLLSWEDPSVGSQETVKV
jgi:hypothetical protein